MVYLTFLLIVTSRFAVDENKKAPVHKRDGRLLFRGTTQISAPYHKAAQTLDLRNGENRFCLLKKVQQNCSQGNFKTGSFGVLSAGDTPSLKKASRIYFPDRRIFMYAREYSTFFP